MWRIEDYNYYYNYCIILSFCSIIRLEPLILYALKSAYYTFEQCSKFSLLYSKVYSQNQAYAKELIVLLEYIRISWLLY